jgi:hypothetical protein
MEQVRGNHIRVWMHGPGRIPRKLLVWTCLVAGLCRILPQCQAADDSLEYQVKAAFLLNFTKFVEWPPTAFETAESPIAICILGDDPFGSALDRMVSGEAVNGRSIAVQRIKRDPPPKSCQVLFVERTERDLPKLLAEAGHGVLTVGEGEGFMRSGGMIAFVIENRRVRFDIHQTTAENSGLKLSSKLLSVAKTVEK